MSVCRPTHAHAYVGGRGHANSGEAASNWVITVSFACWAFELPQGCSIVSIAPGATPTMTVPAFEPVMT